MGRGDVRYGLFERELGDMVYFRVEALNLRMRGMNLQGQPNADEGVVTSVSASVGIAADAA